MLHTPISASVISFMLIAISIFPTSAQSLFQFTYQSQSVGFSEWISLLTLCLAPLIAHIIAGVPTPIYLSPSRPPWHDLIGHFNPTSILWRYFVVTDRRTRAKRWTSTDMAASCALFWTENGWDGSVDMMLKSRTYCTRLPSLRRINLFSVSAATTIIVTIQGIQSIYSPVQGFSNGNYAYSIAFDSIFYSLAFLGLMRLPAALWLTEDYSYVEAHRMEITTGEVIEGVEMDVMPTKPGSSRTLAAVGLLPRDSRLSISQDEMFYPWKSWRGISIRAIFLVPLIGSVTLSTAYIGQSAPGYGLFFTGTQFVLVAFYLILTLGVILIFCAYFWTGNTGSTVLPCVATTWYKAYTGFLIILMVVAIVVSGLETRKSKCGIYTTMRPYYDQFGCAGM